MRKWQFSALGPRFLTFIRPPRRYVPLFPKSAAFSSSASPFKEPGPLYDVDNEYDEDDEYYGSPNQQAKRVAVLGGGITGLVAAHELANQLPNAKITLYEATKKLGGWIDTERIEVDDGHILFEWGPRTLRSDMRTTGHNSRWTVELVSLMLFVILLH